MLPRIPNVSGWLKKWQLRLHLECPLWYSEKLVNGTKWHLQQGALPSCHPVFPALLWPWIYIGYQSPYQVKHHAVFDIHHLLMGCSLIAAGECLASLLSHWLIHGEGPPTEGPHLLSVLGAPLLTYNGCDTHKKITCRVAFPPFFFRFVSISLSVYTSFILAQRWV